VDWACASMTRAWAAWRRMFCLFRKKGEEGVQF